VAFDRFVRWQAKRPTDKELRHLLEDYLGGMGKIKNKSQKKSKRPWFFVTLPGRPSFPFRRMPEIKGTSREAYLKDFNERWFEVYVDDKNKYVDVMTRQGDELTGVIAQGFAELLTRYFKAKLEV